MACVSCEHCQGPLSRHETVLHDGYSYHKDCHKCYVCSETNLKDAEVFKGVIFCASCSQRIFQGCSTVRWSRNSGPNKPHRQHRRRRSHARRSQRACGVIDMARRRRSIDTCSSSGSYKPTDSCTIIVPISPKTEENYPSDCSGRRASTDKAVTTDVTQHLLRDIQCPVFVEWHTGVLERDHENAKPRKKTSKEKNKPVWSDIRIAELGASTEIANMALRKQSTDRFGSKKESSTKDIKASFSISLLTDINDELEGFTDTTFSSHQDRNKKLFTRFVDRPLRSIFTMPYNFFKENILARSSLVSVVMKSRSSLKCNVFGKLKRFFHEEERNHQERGFRKLYPTIHRCASPYRLGWLHVPKDKPHRAKNSPHCKDCKDKNRHKRCLQSHSYRCFREQVMARAGPTKSQLALFRAKCKQMFVKGVLTTPAQAKYSNNKSTACGISPDQDKEEIREIKLPCQSTAVASGRSPS